jgi:hypothetical protein
MHMPDSIETEIFHGDDSTKYSQVSQDNLNGLSELYIAALKVVNGKSFIVYRQLDYWGWGKEIVLANNGNCRSPKIQLIWYAPCLSYTNDINGKTNIILIEQLNQPIDTLQLFGYPLYDYDNFWDQTPEVLTKTKDFYKYGFYTYTALGNDSLFIRLSKSDYNQGDTLLYTKVNHNNLYLGSFGKYGADGIYYTVWEDSISGDIQLFGRKSTYNIGAVNDKYSPSSFTLYQNYPNPFNPTTTISYRLKEKGLVKLMVYDIKGSLIKTLVSQTKDPGSYETQFNAKGLASGIYFYKLEVFGKGSSPVYSEIKKLVLLK